jgi:hypothetical protein
MLQIMLVAGYAAGKAVREELAILLALFLLRLVAGACNQRYLQLWTGAA